MFQHTERAFVADQALKVAPGRANNRRTAHARSGQHIVEAVKPGHADHRRGGQEPARERQQANAGEQRHDSQHDAERQQPFVAFIERQIR